MHSTSNSTLSHSLTDDTNNTVFDKHYLKPIDLGKGWNLIPAIITTPADVYLADIPWTLSKGFNPITQNYYDISPGDGSIFYKGRAYLVFVENNATLNYEHTKSGEKPVHIGPTISLRGIASAKGCWWQWPYFCLHRPP